MVNPFIEQRPKMQKKIQSENEVSVFKRLNGQKILRKIELVKTRCTYAKAKYLQEYEYTQSVKRRISLFPTMPETDDFESTHLHATEEEEHHTAPTETAETVPAQEQADVDYLLLCIL